MPPGVIPFYDHENQFRAIRKANQLTQSQLAEASGVDQVAISCLERLKPCDFKELAAHLDWDVAELTRAIFGPEVEEPLEVRFIKIAVLGGKPIPDATLMALAVERGLDVARVKYWLECYADPIRENGVLYWKA